MSAPLRSSSPRQFLQAISARLGLFAVVAIPVVFATVVSAIAIAGYQRLTAFAESFEVDGRLYISLFPSDPFERPVPATLKDRIAQIPGVLDGSVYYFTRTFGLGPGRFGYIVNGASQGWVERFSTPPYVEITPEQLREYNADPAAMIASESALRGNGWHKGDVVTLDLPDARTQVRARLAVVVPDGFAMLHKVILHAEHLDAQLPPELRGRANYQNVPVDPKRAKEVQAALETLFEREAEPVFSFVGRDAPDYLVSRFERRTAVRDLAIFASFMAAIGTSCAIALARRRRKAGEVSLFGEVMVLHLVAGALGAGVAFVLFHSKSIDLSPGWILRNPIVTPKVGALAFCVAALIGLGSVALLAICARLGRVERSVVIARVLLALSICGVASATWAGVSRYVGEEAMRRLVFDAESSAGQAIVSREHTGDLLSNVPLPLAESLAAEFSRAGSPLVSIELVVLQRVRSRPEVPLSMLRIRGVDAPAYELHGVQLVDGRMPGRGEAALIIGEARAAHYHERKVRVGKEWWPIVGTFRGKGDRYDSELWGDRGALARVYQMSSVTVVRVLPTPAGPVALADEPQLKNLKALSAREQGENVYRALANTTAPALFFIAPLVVAALLLFANGLHLSARARSRSGAGLVVEGAGLALLGAALALLALWAVRPIGIYELEGLCYRIRPSAACALITLGLACAMGLLAGAGVAWFRRKEA